MSRCISNNEIETLGQALMKQYIETMNLKHVFCMDIEGFVTDFLGLPIEYESIAEEQTGEEKETKKLGFLSDGITKLKVVLNGIVQEVTYPRDTIVIDKMLLNPEESGRKRFTIAHEAGHYIMVKHCSLSAQASFHREFDSTAVYSPRMMKQLYDMNERYANRAAACLLLPADLMSRLIRSFNKGRPVRIFPGNVLAEKEKLLIKKMADAAGTTNATLFYRLRELHLFQEHPMDEYLRECILKKGVVYAKDLPFI